LFVKPFYWLYNRCWYVLNRNLTKSKKEIRWSTIKFAILSRHRKVIDSDKMNGEKTFKEGEIPNDSRKE
jgi:hypothetical protein